MSGDSSYSYSLTTFSRTGKLLQIEYALAAVENGKTSLGIKALFLPASVRQKNESVRCGRCTPVLAPVRDIAASTPKNPKVVKKGPAEVSAD